MLCMTSASSPLHVMIPARRKTNHYSSTNQCHEIINNLIGNFKFLAPPTEPNYFYDWFDRSTGGPRLLLKDEGMMEVLRGGIVRAMAVWEAFVARLLREAFEKLIDSAEDFDDMKTKWGKEKGAGHYRIKLALDEALGRRCKENKERESVLEALSPVYDWKKLLKEYYADPILDTDIRPVFGGDKSIDKTVTKLFKVQKSILDLAINDQYPPEVAFYVGPPRSARDYDYPPKVQVKRHGLVYICLLYYGFRCVLAHGIPNRTLENGVLKNFDDKLRKTARIEEFNVENISKETKAQEALGVTDAKGDQLEQGLSPYKQAAMLLTLRENIENHASDAHISYQTWLNICYHLKESAMWLDEATHTLIQDLPNL